MFSKPNPFDESVIAATNENLTGENWELILAVTDKITRASPESARECVAAVEKRLNNKNPNVQLYAIALTEALVKNCDITVHREISSRSFTNTLTRLVHDRSLHAKVRLRILEFIQMCSFEFRADSTLGLMSDVYQSLRAEGIIFPSPQKPKKEFTQSELDKQKEEEEFQLALALSLSESENRTAFKSSASTTPTATTSAKPKSSEEETTPQISRVRALYDFQPTEQGELGFEKGDIIRVIESVYRDWWKGELRGKTGIFPVNYVEKIVDPSPSDLLKEASVENEVMNETRNIDRLLEMLSSTDPRARDSFSDNEELQALYNSTLSIRPKLVKLIEKYSLKKDELVALNEKFMQARTMYDGMLSNSIARYSTGAGGAYGYPQQQQPQNVYVNGNYGYPPSSAVGVNQSYTSTPAQQQPTYGYPPQPQQQLQQQSPAPQNQATPVQQPAYSYTEQVPPPQQQHQQQSQYDYSNASQQQQGQYQQQQQQPYEVQQQHPPSDYAAQSSFQPTSATNPPVSTTSPMDHQGYSSQQVNQSNYTPYPALQHQQQTAPPPPNDTNFPPINYNSSGQQPYSPQAPVDGAYTNKPPPPQQAYAHNY